MRWPFAGRERELRQAVRELAGPSARGIVVAGPPYVGRTRFLRELERVLPRADVVHRVVATRSGRELPFACLGRLAPAAVDAPHRWLDELTEHVGGAGGVLVVDDAQWADRATAQLLLEAARERRLRLALAVRTGHRPPDAVTTLWKDQLLTRVDLAPLDRDEHAEVVGAVLGGRVSGAVRQELWDVSRGYPLVLREYLQGGIDAGAIVEEDGVWVNLRPLEPSPRYVDLVRALLGDLANETVDALYLVALGEPLEPEILDRLTRPEVVAALERASAVVVDPSTGRYRMQVPGARLAILRALEPSVMRVLSRRLSASITHGELHEDDLVRYAIWRLDAGDTADGSLFVRAAERTTSTFDHELTERLARAALPGGGFEAEILLANSLIHQHRDDEAEEHLAQATRIADTDERRARAAGIRSRLLFFRLGRMGDGIDVLERACDEVEDPDVRDQLRGSLALLISMRGDLDTAIQLCDLVLDRDETATSARAVAAMSAGFAHVLRGDLTAGRRHCESALRLPAGPVTRVYPMARPMLEFTLMLAEVYSGAFDAAEELASSRYRAALEAGIDEVSGIWAGQLSGLMLWRGNVTASLDLSAESRRLLSSSDPMGVRTLAYAIGANAAAEAGDVATAERLLASLREIRSVAHVRSVLLEERAHAMLRAAAGELESAAEALVASTHRGVEHGHWTWAAVTAYHAVRFGYAEPVVDVLEDVGARGEGVLLPVMARHARALTGRDVDGLDHAARELAAIGPLLWAAEAYAQAFRLAVADGSRARAALLRSRAVALLQRCPGAATPALRGIQVTPLTRREQEIAMLAAGGRTSREIAERLVVSVRTVDNHLASVYRKLDIPGRSELPAALAVDLG